MSDAAEIDPRTGRLTVATVLRIERLVGGDPIVKDLVVRFIAARWGARNLLSVPLKVADGIFERPEAFLRAAKRWCEPGSGLD